MLNIRQTHRAKGIIAYGKTVYYTVYYFANDINYKPMNGLINNENSVACSKVIVKEKTWH